METQTNLKGTVLPILERLHSEIKNKSKEYQKGAFKGSKEVDKARNTTQKHIELLGQHTASYSASGGRIEPSNDPYILQRGVKFRLNRQVLEENSNRSDLIAVQDNFKSFEAHIIATFQTAMQAFLTAVGTQADKQRTMYSDMVATTLNIPPDFEWNGFIHRNSGTLIDPSAPKRTISNISFPNENHASTKPLIAGSLERKSRVALKGYDTGYYVVTPSKYLHQFKDDDDFRSDPTPELSLYLPDCTIGAINGEKFNVKGKDSSKGKVGSAMAMNHELAFKAHTHSDAEKWYSVIKQCSDGGAGSSIVSPVSAGTTTASSSMPSSPADSRNVSGQHAIPQTAAPGAVPMQQPAPLQTSAPQHPTGYHASPITPGTGATPGGVGQTKPAVAGSTTTPTSGVPGQPGQY